MGHFDIFTRLLLKSTGRMTCLWLAFVMMWCLFHPGSGCAQSFIRVNTGTKSEIRKIKINPDGSGFFMANKIYSLDGEDWEKVDFPISGRLAAFDAISKSDIWYSAEQETSTSLLYHYHDGINENIPSPFANVITSVFFASDDLGFFASYSDVSIYHNGEFLKVNPVASSGYITKISGMSPDKFWVLSHQNELFVFEEGRSTKMLPGKVVKDFQFFSGNNGFVLCEDEILEIHGTLVVKQYRNPLFRAANRIYLRNGDELWVIGDGGLILVQHNGILRRIKYEGKENLTSVAFSGKDDIWISGDNGLLLYSGSKRFSVYNERYPGFSAQKLSPYGIEIDNEYGVAIVDFNGDGMADIYAVCISDPDRLFINNIRSTPGAPPVFAFSEEAAKRGVLGLTKESPRISSELKLGVAVADVDNDGDEDIYVTSLNGRNKLLLNNGKGFFRNVSGQGGRACDDLNRSNAAVFADVDLDGDLDLFVTSELGSNKLYLNDGNGYFTDVTESAGLKSSSGGMCASFCDVNADGYPDLCVTFWYPSNKIYINATRNGKVRFRDITASTDLSKSEPAKSNGVVFADVNNDGSPDLFIANRQSPNKLYLNDGKGIFKDATPAYFDRKVYMSNGAVFADFDLDGYQDLYITNVGDNVMYRNIDGKHFEDVTGNFGTEMSGYCTGCAVGDIDNDGDVDFYVANYINGSSMLFLNKMEKKNSVTFKLEGTRSNRDAIGAKFFLYVANSHGMKDSLAGYREISGGGGYGSVSAKEAIFAMKPGRVYYAVVKFPASGTVKIINQITAGTVIRVEEEIGFARLKTLSKKMVFRFFTDREILLEIAKYLVVLMMLLIYLRVQRRRPARIVVIRWLMCLALFIIFSLVNGIFIFSSSIPFFLLSPAVAVIGLIILHLVTERILLKRIAEREKKELREKISRDLHDDLASTLGSISIYSSTLKGIIQDSNPNFQKLSAKIAELTQTALQSIADIIWMTAPKNDSLRSLLSKVNNLMFDVLTDNGIRFDEKVDIPEQEIILSEKLRHDSFLILKEALNNITRHAQAHTVTLRAWSENSRCFIQLTDDGTGFRVKELAGTGGHGNGLLNMKRRAIESGIELKVESTIDSGSRIEISFKI